MITDNYDTVISILIPAGVTLGTVFLTQFFSSRKNREKALVAGSVASKRLEVDAFKATQEAAEQIRLELREQVLAMRSDNERQRGDYAKLQGLHIELSVKYESLLLRFDRIEKLNSELLLKVESLEKENEKLTRQLEEEDA